MLQFSTSNFAAGPCQLLYLGLPLACLLHIEEAQALPPRQGSSPWGVLKANLLFTLANNVKLMISRKSVYIHAF
jgi:hypothetical protein